MSLSIWSGGHIYGPRLGIANKICSALGLFDIWPGGHIYCCASAQQIKFALLSAYSIFGLAATYTVAPRHSK